MSNNTVFARMPAADKALIRKICQARGEQLSDFVRRAIRRELVRLGYLDEEEKKALGVT